MAAGKEIKTKIRSIQSTRKITSAMELVAASKMKKAQDRMSATRPYNKNMRALIKQIEASSSEYSHSFMEEREVKNAGVIVVSSDRGLCGGLNYALFKKVLESVKASDAKKVSTKLAVLGSKGNAFFKSIGSEVVASQNQISEQVAVSEFEGVLKVATDLYLNGEIDSLHIAYNKFVNTMTQQPMLQQLIPLPPYSAKDADDAYATSDNIGERQYSWDYLYEPDAKELLDKLLQRYIESSVFQTIVENSSCEQAARMLAMKNASDNAADLIEELQLVYNKARQAVITQEISEIVAGSEVF
ncbi:MAG: F0F1 ATP synthase subunit gamma [Gammaproteobacteria bacterium]|nr:F0F1 ATP synthase subunit gamma [Gammaproteobacteria bacterium]